MGGKCDWEEAREAMRLFGSGSSGKVCCLFLFRSRRSSHSSPAQIGQRFNGTLAHPRRLQQRSGWVSVRFFLLRLLKNAPQPSVFADEEHGVFPDEHLGNQYALNWAVASYNMTAAGSAYHNLHLRGLAMLAEDKVDARKAVVRSVDTRDNGQVLVAGSPELPEALFGQLVRQAREALSASPRLFVHDGSVGLTRDSGPTVRSFCDSGSAALMLHHLLRSFRLPLEEEAEVAEVARWTETLPPELRGDADRVAELVRLGQLRSPAVREAHTLTQFLLPSFAAAVPAAKSGNVTLLDPRRRIVMHMGSNVNAAAVRAGLMRLAALSGTWPAGALPLRADAFLAPDNRGAVLVFGLAGTGGAPAWSAHDTLWLADETLVPVWFSGAVEGGQTAFGDLVEQNGAQSSVLGRRRSGSEPFSVAPTAIVFVDAARKEAAAVKANPEQARQHGLPDALVERVTKSKLPLFLAGQRPAAVPTDKWIQSIVAGKAK